MVVDSPDVGLPLSFSKQGLLLPFPRLSCSFIRVRSLLRAKGTHHAPRGAPLRVGEVVWIVQDTKRVTELTTSYEVYPLHRKHDATSRTSEPTS